jgi:tetratricopeptide (TPR) repeat protein
MFKSGDCIGGYALLHPIGEGGFGVVWLARRDDGRLVALKELRPVSTGNKAREQDALLLFAEAATDIEGLVPILDQGQVEENFYYVMPLADGVDPAYDPVSPEWKPRTLSAVVDERRKVSAWFSSEEILAWFLLLAGTVEALTGRKLIHRDIKPDNILFIDGKICLSDIGLMGLDDPFLSRAGTPVYAAPSWYVDSGGHPDLWGLSCTLFNLLTGNHPDAMGREAYRWPPGGRESLTREEQERWLHFLRCINRATDEVPNERYRRVADFAAALTGTSPRFSRRRMVQAAAGGAALLAGTGFIIVAKHRNVAPEKSLEEQLKEATALVAANEEAQAVHLYNRILTGELDDPDRAGVLLDMAVALGRLDRDREAIDTVSEAMRLVPDSRNPYVIRSSLHARAGRKKEALDDYTIFMDMAYRERGGIEGSCTARLMRGSHRLHAFDDPEGALADFTEAFHVAEQQGDQQGMQALLYEIAREMDETDGFRELAETTFESLREKSGTLARELTK